VEGQSIEEVIRRFLKERRQRMLEEVLDWTKGG